MKNRKEFRLEMDCDQDWNAMMPTSCGRFCAVCDKVVLDLRGRSYDEIKELRKESKICGIFLPEQVRSGLPIKITAISKTRLWLAAAVAFLGLEVGVAHAQKGQDTVEVIQVKQSPVPLAPNNVSNAESAANSQESTTVTTPATATKRKSEYYVSKRFPFIHKRKKKSYMMGCPSF